MIIDKNIEKYCINYKSTVSQALKKLNSNNSKIVFVTDKNNKLKGSLSDGDIRRWLIKKTNPNLSSEIKYLTNNNPFSIKDNNFDTSKDYFIQNKIEVIPIINSQKKIKFFIKQEFESLKIGNKIISINNPTFIIAEIGNNHNGDIKLAKELIIKSKEAGADCVKFQMRNMKELYKNYDSIDKNKEDLGSQYVLGLLEKYQLDDNSILKLMEFSSKNNIIPLCTPFDEESLKTLIKYGVDAIKIASADLNNHDLLISASRSNKPIICSTGMSTEDEIINSIKILKNEGASYSMLHCNSTYPAPFKDINLQYLKRLSELSSSVVGYSGHERGISVPIAAVTLGARIIEKHITINKNMEGNDHKVSILPEEFRDMVDNIRNVEESLGDENIKKISQGELINREVLSKSLFINTNLKKGQVIKSKYIYTSGPGKGLPPYYKKDLIGKIAKRDFKENDNFFLSDLENKFIFKPMNYKFKLKWGYPVRFHDINDLYNISKPEILEIHLSFKDLDVNFDEILYDKYDSDLIVHSPEQFDKDLILDLCSFDIKKRNLSIKQMKKVINLVKKIKQRFNNYNDKILLITNVGGYSYDKNFNSKEIKKLEINLLKSLDELKDDEVEIIPQTMPPYPWHFGGQNIHNLFLDPKQISDFCKKNGYRVCFDISHSALFCNNKNIHFENFIKKISKHVAHLHISDALGVDGEGLEIGDGEINFIDLSYDLKKLFNKISFIPEVWQGHKNEGSGFWKALNYLYKNKIV